MTTKLKNGWMQLKIVADYNVKPCKVQMVDYDMGAVPYTEMTGLGWFGNPFLSTTVNAGIQMYIKDGLKDFIESSLDKFNCEDLRP